MTPTTITTEETTMTTTTLPALGSTLTLTYDPRVSDPHPINGGQVFPVLVVEVGDDYFDAQPDYSDDPNEAWSVLVSEIEDGIVAIDPKQVA